MQMKRALELIREDPGSRDVHQPSAAAPELSLLVKLCMRRQEQVSEKANHLSHMSLWVPCKIPVHC